MFSVPLIIVIVTALAATGVAALGLRVFFRLLEPAGEPEPVPTSESRRRRE